MTRRRFVRKTGLGAPQRPAPVFQLAAPTRAQLLGGVAVLAVTAVGVLPPSAHAVPVSWAVDVSADYNTPGDWSGGLVPGSGDDVTIDRGATAVTVTNSLGHTVLSLTTGANATLAITSASQFITTNGGTNAGKITVADQTSMVSGGTINNTGTIGLNSTGNNTEFQVLNTSAAVQTTTLSGTGSVEMSNAANNRILAQSGEDKLVNDTGHTIRGAGQIGVNQLFLDNKGLIEATKSAGLVIDGTGTSATAVSVTNSGTMQANGGTLTIKDSNVNNTGTIIAQNGSTVTFNASRVNGTLSTVGTGKIDLAGNSVLNNNTISTGSLVTVGQAQIGFLDPGTITNNGTILMNSGGGNPFSSIVIVDATAGTDTVTLSGSGALVMGSSGGNAIASALGNDRLVNDVSHTIRGVGNVGGGNMLLENKGLIEATQIGGLAIDGTGNSASAVSITNSGTLQANGGILTIRDSNVNNTGTIIAQNANTVVIEASRVNGILTTLGTGQINLTGSSILSNATITTGSLVTLANGQLAFLDPGTITNNGTIQLNDAGATSILLVFNATAGQDTTTLSGNGVIVMTNSGSNRIFGSSGDRLINDTSHTIRGSGIIGNSFISLENKGLIEATGSVGLTINGIGTSASAVSVTNSGVLQANGGPLTINDSNVLNTGTLQAKSGSLVSITASNVNNQGVVRAEGGGDVTFDAASTATNMTTTPGTLTGGIWQADGAGSTITLRGSNIATNAADITLRGVGSDINVAGTSIDSTLFTNNGSLRIHEGRVFTATANGGNFANNGLLELASGSATSTFKGNASLTNSATGTILGYGVVDNRVANTGTINAILGNLAVTGGATGAGALQADGAAAVLNFSAATLASDTKTLNLVNGGGLNLGAQNVSVSSDYTNAAFGVGNAFNGRANVSGAGQILATGDVKVSVSGTGIANGTTATPTLAFGNVHVGDSKTANLSINNTGSTGPVLRGAVQNTGISDTALGVTAQNFGPLALGGATPTAVNYNPTLAGALAGQSFKIATNFDNVGSQTVAVTAAAYDYANPVIQNAQPIAFGNVHTGAAVTAQGIDIQNKTITNAAFQEGLNASAGTTTNGVTASGSFNLLAAGNTNSSGITVGIDTSAAGARNGTATVNFVSDGANTSGLGQKALTAQTVNVTGGVYDFANAVVTNAPINVGNFHTGASGTQALSIQNKTITNAAFQEGLNASVASAVNGAVTNNGTFTNLAAGATNNSAITVGLNTATSGIQNGTVTLNLVSNGSGTSGLGTTVLSQQQVQVTGTAYNLANPTLGTINLGVLHTNTGTQSVGLSVTNTLVGNASFQEGLNASFGAYTNTGAISPTFAGSITNLGAGLTNNSSMTAAVNTNTSGTGVISGNVSVNLTSNGTISGLGNTTLSGQSVVVSGNVTATITNEAIPVINNSQPINFGNVRIGSVVAPVGLSITNAAPAGAFTEGLIAAVAGTTGTGITAAGNFGSAGAGLAPQNTNNGSITVGIDTTTAGAKAGTAQINFQSDGTPFGGSVTNIQPFPTDVAVQGNVYRLANPTLNTTNVALAARVGDASPTANVSVTNISPDAFTEGLKASLGPVTPGAFTNAGSAIANLAAGGTDGTTLKVGLNTATSGSFNGTAQVNFTSTGAGTTGASDQTLAAGNVTLAGNVYQTAQVGPVSSPINFGTVHVGDVVATKAVTIANTASGALVDVVTGGFSTVSAPFSGTGTLGAGVAAGGSSTALQVGLSTASAGNFNGQANLVLASHNTQLSDLSLSAGPVTLTGTVNNYAVAALGKTSGAGALTGGGSSYSLSLGTVTLGSSSLLSSLFLINAAPAGLPADLLNGSFSINSGAGVFGLSGFDAFSALAAATQLTGMNVTFDPLSLGFFNEVISLHWNGTNPDYIGPFTDLLLSIFVNVVNGGEVGVPEPPGWMFLLFGVSGLLLLARCNGKIPGRRPEPLAA